MTTHLFKSLERYRQTTISGLLVILLLCPGIVQSVFADNDPEYQFHMGEQYYNRGDYDNAIEAFSVAVASAPSESVYYHWLGKSYGRLAEKSGLLKAYNLSGKTRDALEQAVALDNTNVAALLDLLEYYENAPVFLGGGKDKASGIRQRLLELGHQTGGS